MNLTGDGDPERIGAGSVTANLFSTLGVSPIRGRVFTAAEDVEGGPRVVLIGYGCGNGATPAIRRSSAARFRSTATPYQVIGVMPADFVLPTDFQNPTRDARCGCPRSGTTPAPNHGSHGFYAAARLKDGATVAQAQDEMHRIAQAMTQEGLYPRAMQFDVVVVSLRDEVVGGVRRAIWLLLGAVGFLLLIACANVANLLLARAEARQREIAVRSALGAGRLRVARQLFTESLVLASISAGAGLLLAWIGVRPARLVEPGERASSGRRQPRRARPVLHRPHRAVDHARVRSRAARAAAPHGSHRRHEGRQREHHGRWRRASASATRSSSSSSRSPSCCSSAPA